MVSALGQADSFNSSGATIMPDRNEDGGTRQSTRSRMRTRQQVGDGQQQGATALRGLPSFVNQSRMVMPEDSFGRELQAMVASAGDEGQGQAWSFVREGTAPAESQPSSQPLPELSFSQLLNIPSSPPGDDTAGQPAAPQTDQQIVDRLQAYFNENNLNPASAPMPPSSDFEAFRPMSAHSHSASEYSFESTDVDTDSVMSDANPVPQPGHDRVSDLGFGGMNLDMGTGSGNGNSSSATSPHHFWMPSQEGQGGRNNGNPLHGIKEEAEWARSRTVAPDSVSPPGGASSGGAQRDSAGPEDETSRQARLEHRRHINRKSAQKHRKRRKEELEVLTQRVAERDHKIAQLERELAVEKAKNSQVTAFLRANGVKLNADTGS